MFSNRKLSNLRRRTGISARFVWLTFILCLASAAALAATPGPSQFGRVTLDKYSRNAGLGPVVFDHWLHRSKFTCRLCHVDLGFAMQANATDVRAATNKSGFHCGACHDGRRLIEGRPIFASCTDSAPTKQCARCHSLDNSARQYNFETFTAKFPKASYGIDWEETEATGLIKPVDSLEGITIKKTALRTQQDFAIQARVTWASDIIFSHRKHTIWNGCELCHPEIFPATKKGVVRYTMFHISNGQYCGVCHGKVAFATTSCGGCHKNMRDKESLRDVVVMPGPARAAGFGSVKFTHKTHVGERNVKCDICHHTKGVQRPEETVRLCTDCHTKEPKPPVKTGRMAAFHNNGASAGMCIDCHKKTNAENFNNDVDFVRSMLPQHQQTIDLAKLQIARGQDQQMRQLAHEIVEQQQAEINEMNSWLQQHEGGAWAPSKCRDCHKRSNNPQ